MKIGIRLKRLLAPILCIAMLSALFAVPAFAEEETAESTKTELLSQLGVLDVTDASQILTKQTVKKGIAKIFQNSVSDWVYFEGQDLTKPMNYGQAVMVLVDALGYSHYVELLGFDPTTADGYINTAKRIRLVVNSSKSANEQMTIGEWSELLYRALVNTELMKPTLYSQNVVYNIVEDSSMLSEYMKLTRVEAKVNGVDNVSISTNDGYGSNRVKLDGVWYTHSFTTDMYKYFGCSVEAFVDLESKELKAIAYLEKENNILRIAADDAAGATSVTQFYYYDKNDRKKLAQISGDADFIYNRELVMTYSKDDLNVLDCNYTLVDNNGDGKYDVVIADKYTSFVVDYRQVENQTVVGTDRVVYDFEEYYKNGNKLYDINGAEYGFNLMHQNCTVSYLKSKTGKLTYAVVMENKYEGKLSATRDNMQYVTIGDEEFKTAAQYYQNFADHDQVKIGDTVMGLVDANGKIMDILYKKPSEKAAYLLAATNGVLDTVKIKMLDEDGVIKTVELSGAVTVDGTREDVGGLLGNAALSSGGELKKQLVTYKQTADGRITAIDTAYNRNVLGECGYKEFTLNYSGVLHCLALNGTNIFGTKYVLNGETKVFNIVKDASGKIVEKDCGVMSGTSFSNNESYNLAMYNVNENFLPEYAVYENTKNEGTWVNVKNDNVYMVEEISECLDDDGYDAYMLSAWDPSGYMRYWFFHDGDLKSAGGAGWSYSWSPDSAVWSCKLKDLPKGSIISIQTGPEGIVAFTAHYIPGVSTTYFEKSTSVSGNYQGIDTNKYNAGCLMSYGKVLDRVDTGFILNNHIPTAKEVGEGGVYPMEEWNRLIMANSTVTVLVYDSERNEIYVDNGNCVVPGDHVFIRRKVTTYNGIYVIK